jgi:hypothetical protein
LRRQVENAPDTKSGRESFAPRCGGAADLLAEDTQRLLFYQGFIPRSVMVEYLKVLIAFHLGLYHLRLLKLLPALVHRQGADPTCATGACPMNPKSANNPFGDCPYRLGMLVDVAGQPGTPMADTHYRRIPIFVRAYFATKKLDEFATDLVRRGKLSKRPAGEFSVGETSGAKDAELDPERGPGGSSFSTILTRARPGRTRCWRESRR